jgi:hypothetical protein
MGDPIVCDVSHESTHPHYASIEHALQPDKPVMTTPRVTELPRRLEPSSRDTFLGSDDETAPLAVVLQLRPRSTHRSLRAARSLAAAPVQGPGNSAA